MGHAEKIIYKCKQCKKYVLGTMGAVAHSRTHQRQVTKDTISDLYRVESNPSPEVVARLKKKQAERQSYKKKNSNGKPPRNVTPETSPEELLDAMPKLSRITDAKADENGVTLTAEIFVSKNFFSSVIVKTLT